MRASVSSLFSAPFRQTDAVPSHPTRLPMIATLSSRVCRRSAVLRKGLCDRADDCENRRRMAGLSGEDRPRPLEPAKLRRLRLAAGLRLPFGGAMALTSGEGPDSKMIRLKVNGSEKAFDGDPQMRHLSANPGRDQSRGGGTRMNTISNVSRRAFLRGVFSAGALVLGVSLAPETLLAEADNRSKGDPRGAVFQPNVFVAIEPDGTVRIVAHRSEMGTGIRTSLPLVLADELDADWDRVKIDQAIGDPRYGSQDTDGSRSIRGFFDTMRECGATARIMLLTAAARQWNVPQSECEARLHTIVHLPTGRKLGYGELATAASSLPVPPRSDLRFKPSAKWRYIGKWIPGYDLRDICEGKPVFGMDARVDGMLYASVEHPPVLGGRVKSVDDKAALSVPGVRKTVAIAPFTPPCGFQPLGGIAVVADNTWAAFQGRRKLNIEWDNGPNESYDSEKYKQELRATSRQPGKVMRSAGDVDAVFAKGGRIVEAEYYVPLLAHASMEPPVAVAQFRGGRVTVWTPTQDTQAVQ